VNRILARNRGHLRDAIRPDDPLSPRVQPFQTKQPAGARHRRGRPSRYRAKWHSE
jgi:hypothetical protein